jgi:CheY-like chemotaxis protein
MGETVVIVDDNCACRARTSMLLGSEGYEVWPLHGGEGALAAQPI